VGLGAAGAGFCAIAMLTPKSSAVAVVKTFFIGSCLEIGFRNCDWVIVFAVYAKTRESGAGL
jgi:hypothetical protein